MASALDLEQDLETLEGRDDGPGNGAGHAAGAKGGNYRLRKEVPELGRPLSGGVLSLDDIFGPLEDAIVSLLVSYLSAPCGRKGCAPRTGGVGSEVPLMKQIRTVAILIYWPSKAIYGGFATQGSSGRKDEETSQGG